MNINLLRLFNFLIDNLIFTIFTFLFLEIFKNSISRESAVKFLFVFYFLYYFLQELYLKKTIGKYITKTIVVNKHNKEKYFIWQIVFRTFIRFIILDIFSYLFTNNGLHDFLSKTETIKSNEINKKVEFRNH